MTDAPPSPDRIVLLHLAEDLRRLCEMDLDAEAAALARSAKAGADSLLSLARQALEQAHGPWFDRQVFAALMEQAGPDTAPILLTQLVLDLGEVGTGLHEALAGSDWETIRLKSHVLLSLSGSIGATRLYALAERLNRLAHAGDRTASKALSDEILMQLHHVREAVIAEEKALAARAKHHKTTGMPR